MLPTDFGSALQGFARSFANQGDDGVFRYEPNHDEAPPTVDDAETDDWFSLASDPQVAQAVAEAEAVARKPVAPGGGHSPARSSLPYTGAEPASTDPRRPNPSRRPSPKNRHPATSDGPALRGHSVGVTCRRTGSRTSRISPTTPTAKKVPLSRISRVALAGQRVAEQDHGDSARR